MDKLLNKVQIRRLTVEEGLVMEFILLAGIFQESGTSYLELLKHIDS